VTSTPFGVFQRDVPLQEEWCGPFSVARQMIAQREEAKRQREEEQETEPSHPLDQAMQELEQEERRKKHPSLLWKSRVTPSPSSFYSKRQKRVDMTVQVPSLFSLCTSFLVDNFEQVEALGNVDTSIRTSIIKELVSHGKLNEQAFTVLAETGMEALEVVDCSEITQDVLTQALERLLPTLRYLVLDQCGRCFGHKAVEMLVSNNSLFALSIGGAYLLSDAEAGRLVMAAARQVTSLEFKACPLLGKEFIKAISETDTLLELALEDQTLSSECLDMLVANKTALQNLKSLSLRRIEGLTDEIVVKMLEICGGTLEHLDLSSNYSLTDVTLSGIRQCSKLRSLNLSGLKLLTPQGLEALFTPISGMAPPPMLRTLDLGNCDHEAVTDEVLHLVTSAATKQRDGSLNQVSYLGGLVHLNVQGSSLLTDEALESVVSTCAATLQGINLSFCPRVTDKGLGYLVDKCFNQLSRVQVWGCAQLTDDFLEGHRRVEDQSLEIAGVWMKKSTSRTIR
jgi:DNA repair protein RAD7